MGWDTTNIITSAAVREITGMAAGVEDRKIDPGIQDAQHDLQQILGETLYTLIEDADPVGDPTLGGDAGLVRLYNTYVRNYLAWKAKEHALPDMWAEPDRNGVFQRNGDNYTTIGASGLNALQAVPRSRAQNRAVEMVRYLNNLDASDPIRVAYGVVVDDEPRTTKPSRSGNVITRISKWQDPHGNKRRWRDEC